MQKGFTLIEVIIYIALFSFLIGGAFITAYQLIDSSGKLSAKTTTQAEGNFVMRKFNWALTGISSFINTSDTLHLNKYDGNQIDIQKNGTKIEMKESSGSFLPITTDNVQVTSLEFQFIPASGSGPAGITATAKINGLDFTITKYIRK